MKAACKAPWRFQKLTFLGTSSGIPTKTRNVSGLVLSLDNGQLWLFDCGEGLQQQLMRSNLNRGKIAKIFITHMHGDHCFGLPGLLCTLSMTGSDKAEEENACTSPNPTADYSCAEAPEEAPGGVPVIDIFGPYTLGQFLRTSLKLTYSLVNFRYRVHEIIPEAVSEAETVQYLTAPAHVNELRPCMVRPHPGSGIVDDSDVNVVPVSSPSTSPCDDPTNALAATTACCYSLISDPPHSPTVHAAVLTHAPGVFCVGYSMTERRRPGKLDAEALQRLNVPKGPLYAQLKAGLSITLPSGVEVRADDVVGPSQPGRKVVILGDTCDSRNILTIGRDANILVHEATYDDDSAELAWPRGHSTARMAGAFAKQLNARQLVLTHFSARFAASTKLMQALAKKKATESDAHANGSPSGDSKPNPSGGDSAIQPQNLEREAAVAAVQGLLEQARESFGSDSVIAAHDFMEIPVSG